MSNDRVVIKRALIGVADKAGVADFAKALIDRGFHPMTMYFPLVVHGAFLIEPTETESKETLDAFIAAMRDIAAEAKKGNGESFKQSPHYTPRRRLDETRAARQPVLTWSGDPDEGAEEEAADEEPEREMRKAG